MFESKKTRERINNLNYQCACLENNVRGLSADVKKLKIIQERLLTHLGFLVRLNPACDKTWTLEKIN